MIISRSDLVFQFICKHCHQYANKALVCSICETIYCYDCLKQQQRKYKYNGEFDCLCNINYCQQIHCVEQFVADQLKIKCSFCDTIKSINKIKTHEAKCHMKEQEAFNYFSYYKKFQILQKIYQKGLICTQCKQLEFEQNLIKKYDQYIMCKQCIYLDFDPKQQFQIQVSEEQILNFQTLQFQCPNCMKKGDYYQIINHNYICKQQFVDCQCGCIVRRCEFLAHFKICASLQLDNLYLKLAQINLQEKIIKFQYSNRKKEFTQMNEQISNVFEIVYNCAYFEITMNTTFSNDDDNDDDDNDNDDNRNISDENNQNINF